MNLYGVTAPPIVVPQDGGQSLGDSGIESLSQDASDMGLTLVLKAHLHGYSHLCSHLCGLSAVGGCRILQRLPSWRLPQLLDTLTHGACVGDVCAIPKNKGSSHVKEKTRGRPTNPERCNPGALPVPSYSSAECCGL